MSADLLNPEKALIFRIVHKNNIKKVLKHGCHCRNGTDGKYVEIGNQELIQKRTTRSVPCGPGGTLADYVPFYFTPYSPMLYNIKTGYGVPQKPMSDIVMLVSSLRRVRKQGIEFVFTDRHAYLKAAQFSDDLDDLDWVIWPALQARDFRKDDIDKFEKYQAEALIYRHVPVEALIGIVCYNAVTRDAVRTLAEQSGAHVEVIAKSGWYL